MLKLSWTNFFIQAIPESIAVITFCYALLNLDFQWIKIIKQGLALAIATYLIRMLPLPFGVHTIIVIFALAFILAFFIQSNLVLVFKTSIITSIIIAITEIVFNEIFLRNLNLTFSQAYENKLLWTIMGLPHVLLLFILSWIIKCSHYVN